MSISDALTTSPAPGSGITSLTFAPCPRGVSRTLKNIRVQGTQGGSPRCDVYIVSGDGSSQWSEGTVSGTDDYDSSPSIALTPGQSLEFVWTGIIPGGVGTAYIIYDETKGN